MTKSALLTLFVFVLGPASLIPVEAHDDLIYVAVDPCRIVDTRIAGGPIPANDFRNFLTYGSAGELAGQGATGECLNPRIDQPPMAVSAYVLAVSAGTGLPGVLTAYPSDQLPPVVGAGSTVNHWGGHPIGNTTNITLCTNCPNDGDFAILSRNTAEHVVVDVQGFFYPMQGPYAVPERMINRRGKNIQKFNLPEFATWETCEAQCYADTQCVAWTYVHADAQDPRNVPTCWTKFGVPAPLQENCCISGVKQRP